MPSFLLLNYILQIHLYTVYVWLSFLFIFFIYLFFFFYFIFFICLEAHSLIEVFSFRLYILQYECICNTLLLLGTYIK